MTHNTQRILLLPGDGIGPEVLSQAERVLGVAGRLEGAVARVLEDGWRTADIMQPGMRLVGTQGMGDAVVEALRGAAQ